MIRLRSLLKEGNYEVYHNSFTSAAQTAREYALKNGYEINEDDWSSEVSLGGKYLRARPSVGKTNRFTVGLFRNGKEQKKSLNFQVYGMENGKFELNAYIS